MTDESDALTKLRSLWRAPSHKRARTIANRAKRKGRLGHPFYFSSYTVPGWAYLPFEDRVVARETRHRDV